MSPHLKKMLLGGVKTLAPLVIIFLTVTGAGTWTVPANWNSANNSISTIGGGASGAACGATNYASGGGGGAFSSISNQTLTPGASIAYNVGAGGASVNTTGSGVVGNNGGDTWFGNSVYASSLVGAKGGTGGKFGVPAALTLGGQASAGIGTTKRDGGNAGSGGIGATGGGGAAGINGNGNSSANSSGSNGGSGDAGFGGAGGTSTNASSTGGPGGNGTEWDATHGSGGGGGTSYIASTANGGAGGRYGGGGGGGSGGGFALGTSGEGHQGVITIIYQP